MTSGPFTLFVFKKLTELHNLKKKLQCDELVKKGDIKYFDERYF